MEESNSKNLNNKLTQLLAKQVWTAEEKKWLLDYVENTKGEELQSLLRQQLELFAQSEEKTASYDPAEILQLIHEKAGINLPKKSTLVVKFWKRGLAAASIILIFVLMGYFAFVEHPRQKLANIDKAETKKTNQDIHPGTNRATLLLDNGANVILDGAENGILPGKVMLTS